MKNIYYVIRIYVNHFCILIYIFTLRYDHIVLNIMSTSAMQRLLYSEFAYDLLQ